LLQCELPAGRLPPTDCLSSRFKVCRHHIRTDSESSLFITLSPFLATDVGAFFEEGMWLRYNFQASGGSAKEAGSRPEGPPDQQSSPPDLAHEEVHFSFSTTKAPCILLYVSSLTTDFLAVLVKPSGSLQIRYNLGGTREPYSIDVDHRNMASGQPHSVNITRHERTIILK
ncbi:Contactin-associated protein-like 2, partial [Galemys pyrenaicus]